MSPGPASDEEVKCYPEEDMPWGVTARVLPSDRWKGVEGRWWVGLAPDFSILPP